MYDVIVVGAGLHGCSAALHLALRDKRVLVIEKNDAGRHASGVNAGGVRRLGRHPAEIPLSVESLEIWHRIETLVDSDCGFAASGQVKMAETDAELSALEERAAMVRSLGFEHEEMIDRTELRRLCPAAADHCVGGIVSRRDGFANPYRTTRAFRDKAEALGVTFREETRVIGLDRSGHRWRVETSNGTFEGETLLNCAGGWGDQLAAMLGDNVPLSAEAPMMMVTAPTAPFLDPVVGLAGRALSFKQGANGTVVIGGGHRGIADRDSETTTLNLDGLKKSARTVVEVFPHMKDVPIVRCWAGIEGVMPDQIPVVGPSRNSPAAFHAFGFSAHGFQLGPIVGRLMSELIVDGNASLPIEAFRVDRFNTVDEAVSRPTA
ncbi:MAG: FAD-dependent oxidoreductase [Pseudomonadota bacterium]